MRTNLPVSIVLLAFLLTACGDDDGTGPEPLTCTGGTALVLGTTVNGTLEEGDDLDSDGAYLDRFALTVEQRGVIRITMRSADLDSWLWLLNSSGGLVDYDDDGAGGVNGLDARIERELNRGCYLVEATTFVGETGAYSLLAERL
jgi:hypothetical protein